MQVSDVVWCFIYCFAQTPVIGRVTVALKLWQIQHIYDMMQLLLRINSGAAALLVTNTNIAVIAAIVSRSTTAAVKIWGNSTRCTARLASNRPSTSFPHRPLSAHQRNLFQLAAEVQDKRGAVPSRWHNYHRLGFNHTLLKILSAHYLTPNTTAPLPQTGQFRPLMPLRILPVMDNHW